jgi:hypothetical protein
MQGRANAVRSSCRLAPQEDDIAEYEESDNDEITARLARQYGVVGNTIAVADRLHPELGGIPD